MANMSPIFFIGLLIFVLPVITNIINWKLPGWIYTVGVIVIIIGVIHSVFFNR